MRGSSGAEEPTALAERLAVRPGWRCITRQRRVSGRVPAHISATQALISPRSPRRRRFGGFCTARCIAPSWLLFGPGLVVGAGRLPTLRNARKVRSRRRAREISIWGMLMSRKPETSAQFRALCIAGVTPRRGATPGEGPRQAQLDLRRPPLMCPRAATDPLPQPPASLATAHRAVPRPPHLHARHCFTFFYAVKQLSV